MPQNISRAVARASWYGGHSAGTGSASAASPASALAIAVVNRGDPSIDDCWDASGSEFSYGKRGSSRDRLASTDTADARVQQPHRHAATPRVRSRCRFKNRGTEYVSEYGMKRVNGSTTTEP
jgi:hypothetical protein